MLPKERAICLTFILKVFVLSFGLTSNNYTVIAVIIETQSIGIFVDFILLTSGF